MQPLGLRAFEIQSSLTCQLPSQIHAGLAMKRPGRLLVEENVQHRLEEVLTTCHLQDTHGLVRTLVQRRVSQDHTKLDRIFTTQLIDNWMKSSAGLARRVEEFHQGHWRIGWTKDRRIGPDQRFGLCLQSGARSFGLFGLSLTRDIP